MTYPKNRGDDIPAPRLLVMDDEECLRDLVVLVLEVDGYRVDRARHGGEAVDLYQRAMAEEDPYQLVILDLIIPDGIGAVETLDRLRQFTPDLPAILTSGLHYHPTVTGYRHSGFSGVLIKPFECAELSKIVSRIAGSRRPSVNRLGLKQR